MDYPISLPTDGADISGVTFGAKSSVGNARSPFSFSEQIYVNQGQMMMASVELPTMDRSEAEPWIAFLLSLNGMEGTFLMGDPANPEPRGTWGGGAPKLFGAHSARARTLEVYGVEGLTWKAGDWIQFGSGATARLHKVLVNGTQAPASPQGSGTVEIWPALRQDYSADEPLILSNAVGRWRLSSNEQNWSIGLARFYGLRFDCVEAI